MIILTKEMFEDVEQFGNIIEKEKSLINLRIESQKNIKELLLNSMQKFADSTDDVDVNCLNSVLDLLKDLKNALNLIKTNMSLLESIYNMISEINDNKNNMNIDTINVFNNTYFETDNTVFKNTIEIEDILKTILSFSCFAFFDTTKKDNIEVLSYDTFQEANILPDLQQEEKNKILKMPINQKLIQSIDNSDNIENALIVSEQKGKVFLPYTLSNLKQMLIDNPDKYSSVEDIIEKEFSLPFDLYRNPAIARFRETFKLVRKKENKSIKEAFDLGMELLFNYNLHPAIITACKNLDELDIYLDYLESNETHKFDCFKIIFDIAPVLVKNKKS